MRADYVSLLYYITNISSVFIFHAPHMLALPLNLHTHIQYENQDTVYTSWPITPHPNEDKMNKNIYHNFNGFEPNIINLKNQKGDKSKLVNNKNLVINKENREICKNFRCKRSAYFVNQYSDMLAKYFSSYSVKVIRKRSPLDKSTFFILPAGDNIHVKGIAHHSTVVTHGLSNDPLKIGASGFTHVIRTHSSKQNNGSVNVLSRVIPHGKIGEIQDIVGKTHSDIIHSLLPNQAITKSEVTVTMQHPLPSKSKESAVKILSGDDLIHSISHLSPVAVIHSDVSGNTEEKHDEDILFPVYSTLSDKSEDHILATVISDTDGSSVLKVPLVSGKVIPQQDLHVLISAEPIAPEVTQVVLKETTFHVPSTPEIVHHLPVKPALSHVTVSRTSTAKFKLRVLNKNIYRTHIGGYGAGIDVGGHGAGHGYYAYG